MLQQKHEKLGAGLIRCACEDRHEQDKQRNNNLTRVREINAHTCRRR
jgi:hypothetical protein